jgi:Barstar (barnase inhibitor)
VEKNPFLFSDTPSFPAGSFVVEVPAGVVSTDVLLDALYERARFPGYFGFNWNALSDCLRDLHWVESRELVLWHRDLPRLPRDDTRTYLDVLRECVQSWKPEEAHQLMVSFPPACKADVEKLSR